MAEDERAPRTRGDLLLEPRRRERGPALVEPLFELDGCGQRFPVDRRGQGGDARVTRIEDQEAVVGEQLAERAREGRCDRATHRVVRAEQRQRLPCRRAVTEQLAEPVEQSAHLGWKSTVGDGDARLAYSLGGEREGDRSPLGAGDGHRGDLGEVVVLRLQPEKRNAADARLRRQRPGDGDRGGRLVKTVEGPQEEADLLAGGDHRRAPCGQRFDVVRARAAGGEGGLLLAKDRDELGRGAALGRRARARHAVGRCPEVERNERARDRFAGEVRAGECA